MSGKENENSKGLTSKKYWDSNRNRVRMVENQDDITDLLSNYIPKSTKQRSCLEIGCYPGGYLQYLSRRMGFELNGIDYGKDTERLSKVFKAKRLAVDQIIKEDFFSVIKNDTRKYDLVCSFGFVEHFKDYLGVIRLHASLVEEGGYLVITTPNFSKYSLNYFLKSIFEKDSFLVHNIESMQVEKWRTLVESLGFSIKFCGYFGGVGNCWCSVPNEQIYFMRMYVRHMKQLFPRQIDGRFVSKYCGLVAKKG